VPTEQDRERWRAALEYIGTSSVRLRLARIDHIPETTVSSVGRWIIAATIAAAIAALTGIISAWPIVFR